MQSISTRTTRTAMACVATLAVSVSPGIAATTWDWTGATDSDWADSGNWTKTGGDMTSDTYPSQADAIEDDATFGDVGNYLVDLGGATRTLFSLRLSNTSDYTFQNGTLVLNRDSGNGAVMIKNGNATISAATVDIGKTGSPSRRHDFGGSGTVIFTGAVNQIETASLTAGTIQVDGSWTRSGDFTVNRTGQLTVNGTFTATSVSLAGGNANPQPVLLLGDLSGTSATFTVGTINVDTGVGSAHLQSSNATPRTLATVLNFGANTSVTFDGNGGDINFNSNWQGAAGTLTTNIGDGRTVTVQGNFINDATTALTLSGGGMLAVASTSSYGWSGDVNITSGTTLVVDGSMATAPGVVNVTDGTLGGTGSINRNVNVATGGKLAPGQSPGTLNITGVVDLASGFILDWEYGALLKDLVNITGTLDLTEANTSDSTVNLINAGGTLQNGDILFATTGGVTGVLDGTILDWTILGGEGLSAVVDGNNVILIPEPATMLLALAGTLLILPTRRGRAVDAA